MDNLLHPEGALLQAQSLLAEAYGAAQAWFGTCGSTMGNYALILSCAKPDDLILLASDCHISAVHAALLAHYRISLISCDQTAQGLPQPMSYQKAAEALSSHPEAKALVMTSPNYYGFCADIPAIAALCHEKNVALLVDAAHGAHFGFSPLLPIQPVDADGWVVSAHKTLCVSNQGSLIFRGKKSKLDAFRLENNVHRFQSTSPSWPLLAQMDKARAQLVCDGSANEEAAGLGANDLGDATAQEVVGDVVNEVHKAFGIGEQRRDVLKDDPLLRVVGDAHDAALVVEIRHVQFLSSVIVVAMAGRGPWASPPCP